MLNDDTFKNAAKGIVPLKTVGTKKPNHGIVVVGYTPEYWVIQNSWGHTWGYYGYARMAMGNNLGMCNNI
jgi:C1A family cysteine protease